MSEEISIEVGLDDVDNPEVLGRLVARALGRSGTDVPEWTVRRRSLDARRGSMKFHLVVAVGATETHKPVGPPPKTVSGDRRVVVIGDGPAGLFCSYELARHGIPSVVVDRGRQVQPRRLDLRRLNQEGAVDADSNYCFGEGGAGTYSDGKLYTRSHKRGDVRDVLEVLVEHGAPADILVDARPHIGSNRLPKVVSALRERLESVGVEFRFETRVTGLDVDPPRRVRGAMTAGGRVIGGDAVVVATGHSASDVFDLLAAAGVGLEPKSFALGVRIEHPQPLINEIQYGRYAGHPRLHAASYKLAHTVEDRGVFSFCMCPGGWIVPAATEADGLVVNGMSLSRRDSRFANSGMVVSIEVDDAKTAGFDGPLAGLRLQRAIERRGFEAGGGALRAPATRLTDFLAGRSSADVPRSSYVPGLTAGNLADVLDSTGLPIAARLREGLTAFGRKMRGFASAEAVLVGVESRTSCPVRVPRDPESLESPDLAGLYPCGEGAGYAGGIVSAALDGIRVARAIAREWSS
ncbi:MAG: FAD-dependent oxidoreductase [Acidobacteria bacterium]|nr:FAD-dependent oxidoreductase [Acidobacteriota bacterium]